MTNTKKPTLLFFAIFLMFFSSITRSDICNFCGPTSGGGGGGGSGNILSINGDTTAAQTFATGTAGTNFAIVDNGVGTHTFNIPDASATARGLVTTGAQTFAGQKTLSSAPIFSSLAAQAMPYLNASKVLSNGGWTQADTTFGTVFTPVGSVTGNAMNFDFTSATNGGGNGIKLTAAGNVQQALRIDAAYTGAGGADRSLVGYAMTGDSSSGFVWGIRTNNAVACTGDTMGYAAAAAMCAGAVFDTSGGTGSPGTNVGVYGSASTALHNVGGGFQAVAAKAGAGNKTVGVHATASGENSAQTIGIFTKILSANSSANLENYYPAISGALIADNGDTVHNVFTAMDNGTSVLQVRDTGAVVIGAHLSIVTHTLNGTMVGGSLRPVTSIENVVGLSDVASVQVDTTRGSTFSLVATGNRTLLPPTTCIDGHKITIRHKASGAARTLAFTTGVAGGFRFGTDIIAMSQTASGLTDYVGAVCNSGDNRWDVVAITRGF